MDCCSSENPLFHSTHLSLMWSTYADSHEGNDCDDKASTDINLLYHEAGLEESHTSFSPIRHIVSARLNNGERSDFDSPPPGRNYTYIEPNENFGIAKKTYLIGDRDSLSKNREFSLKTHIAKIEFVYSKGKSRSVRRSKGRTIWMKEFDKFDFKKFSDRKILVLIHGFTVDYNGALKTLGRVAENIGHIYDIVIGYLYPAYAKPHEYARAEQNAIYAGKKRLPHIIASIQSVAKHLDIAAHSMGTIVAMHALNQGAIRYVNNLFLAGGVVGEKNILCEGEECKAFPYALSKVGKIYVLYSCKDEILPWLRFFHSEQPAGRLDSAVQQMPIAKNVCLINATSVVKSHSGYFKSEEVFKFFKLVAHHNDQNAQLEGAYFSLTPKGLSFVERPIICSKGTNGFITVGLFFKKMASFKLGQKGKERDQRKD